MRRSYRRATRLYKHALALEPQSASIHVNVAMVWLARHNDAEWERDLQAMGRHGLTFTTEQGMRMRHVLQAK